MKPRVVSTLGVLLLISGFAPAHADRVSPCKIIRAEGAAILQLCGGARLRSFALSMQGTERTAVQYSNKFRFSCRPGFCQDEPDISGSFIDPDVWTRSKKDEAAVFDIMAAQAGWKLLGSEQHFRGIFKPTCDRSVTVAGLPGRMICYNTGSAAADSSPAVIMVAADDRVGFMLSFQSPDSKNVSDDAVSALRAFSLERGEGDVTLERWFR